MSQNKTSSGSDTGLQAVAGKNLPGDLKKKANGEFVEMQELLPVMSSFHEHLADEQRKNQTRLRGLFTLFALLFAAFLIVPVYMGRIFLEQMRASIASQKEAQAVLGEKISDSMSSLAQASRDLREELARQRELRESAPPPVQAADAVPVVVDVVPESPVVKSVEEKPAEEKPVSKRKQKAEAPAPVIVMPPAPEPPPVTEAIIARPEPEPAAEVVSETPKTVPAAQADLEVLLRQVEQAISDKEKELKTRK